MDELLGLLQELDNIEQKKFDWRSCAFDKQIAFIEDPSRLKAAFTTRRGAKSYTDGIYLLKEAFENPGSNSLYLGLTRLSAKAIIWKDVFKELDYKFDLGLKFNETELTVTTPNGSVIYVAGVDVDDHERKKLFGRKYRLAVIDEAALYTIDLYDLVYVALKPAMADLRGTIVMSGMSSNITHGLFYDVTTKREAGWSLHEWTAYDNPHMKVQWTEEIEDIKKNRPEFMKTARFKQAYLNQWVVDDDARVYRFDKKRNFVKSKPLDITQWNYVLGVDLGHSPDPSTFVVGCYNQAHPKLYLIHAEKHLKMDVTDVANKIRALDLTYKFEVKVIDGANKQAVAELNNRQHNVGVITADKRDKSEFINLMNDDFIQGKILLLDNGNEGLSQYADEMERLVWIVEDGKVKLPRKEHPTLPNNLCDAALYLWRHCYNYLLQAETVQPNLNDPGVWHKHYIQKTMEAERLKHNQNELLLELDPMPDLFDFDQDNVI